MHNLYLGTGKKTFEVWVKQKLLSDEALIENRVKHFIVPYDIGRLPSNISSGYGDFTANQWYNWITIYSPILLKGLLPPEHLRCWLLFVKACSITKSRIISVDVAKSADLFLLHFCRCFQSLYGAETCTPNIHLHTHIIECILDYGPLHAFWCYAFEWYNGILGSMQMENQLKVNWWEDFVESKSWTICSSQMILIFSLCYQEAHQTLKKTFHLQLTAIQMKKWASC